MKSFIDMRRATLLYGAGVVALMLVSLVLSNVPEWQFSRFVDFELRRPLAGVLAACGALTGLLAMWRHLARTREPHRVPQSQISILYLAFFFTSVGAVILAK
jgi:uncharacterized membrane protein YccC